MDIIGPREASTSLGQLPKCSKFDFYILTGKNYHSKQWLDIPLITENEVSYFCKTPIECYNSWPS